MVALPGDQSVTRLDVAVDEAAGVGGVEGGGDLVDDRRRAGGLERSLAQDQRVEIGALDEAHRQVELTVLLAGVIDRDHVGVIDRGRRPRLLLEALAEALVPGEVGGDQLQRDLPAEVDLDRPVDDAHPAATDLLDHAVTRKFVTWAK